MHCLDVILHARLTNVYLSVPGGKEQIYNDNLRQLVEWIGSRQDGPKESDLKKGMRFVKSKVKGSTIRQIKFALRNIRQSVIHYKYDEKYVFRCSRDHYTDIEKISRDMSGNKVTESLISIDTVIALSSLSIDKIWGECAQKWAVGITLVLAVITLGWVLGKKYYDWQREKNTNWTVRSPKEMRDMFDNSTCYCVMMADSYCRMLEQAAAARREPSICEFYYTETWYYINKAKAELHSTSRKADEVFESEVARIAASGKISTARLKNVINIIENTQTASNLAVSTICCPLNTAPVKELNRQYDRWFREFVRVGNESLHLGINIDFDSDGRLG